MIYTGELECLRCGALAADPAVEVIGSGCPSCASEGAPANMLPRYDLAGLSRLPLDASVCI